jgi:hypothetical protein
MTISLPMIYVFPLKQAYDGSVCMVCKAQGFAAVAAFVTRDSVGSHELMRIVSELQGGAIGLLRWIVYREHPKLVNENGDVRPRLAPKTARAIVAASVPEVLEDRAILSALAPGSNFGSLGILPCTRNFVMVFWGRRMELLLQDPLDDVSRFPNPDVLRISLQAAIDQMMARGLDT